MSSTISASSTKRSKVLAKTTNPGGTAKPACDISPRDAPLPPARPTEDLLSFLKGKIKSFIYFYALIKQKVNNTLRRLTKTRRALRYHEQIVKPRINFVTLT